MLSDPNDTTFWKRQNRVTLRLAVPGAWGQGWVGGTRGMGGTVKLRCVVPLSGPIESPLPRANPDVYCGLELTVMHRDWFISCNRCTPPPPGQEVNGRGAYAGGVGLYGTLGFLFNFPISLRLLEESLLIQKKTKIVSTPKLCNGIL